MTTKSSDIFAELEQWYARRNGEYVLDSIRRYLDSRLDTAFGYHILQLGITRQHPLFGSCNINHRVYASEQTGKAVGLVANVDELPLASDSIDVLIAHHSLEFDENPHQALREMHRVLAPQGHLIVVGFNPYSAFGGAAYLKGLSSTSPWRHHNPVNTARVADWLNLLGCEVRNTTYLYSIPPLGNGKIRDLMINCDRWFNGHNLPLGGLYVMHAVKQVPRLIRPRRRLLPARERLIGLSVAKPTAAQYPAPTIHKIRHGEGKS
jgi:SAM-dependent methyltransferase